ncbi:hypothetical protein REPUB_Repub12eG0176400 [Reevesia pubescens]
MLSWNLIHYLLSIRLTLIRISLIQMGVWWMLYKEYCRGTADAKLDISTTRLIIVHTG